MARGRKKRHQQKAEVKPIDRAMKAWEQKAPEASQRPAGSEAKRDAFVVDVEVEASGSGGPEKMQAKRGPPRSVDNARNLERTLSALNAWRRGRLLASRLVLGRKSDAARRRIFEKRSQPSLIRRPTSEAKNKLGEPICVVTLKMRGGVFFRALLCFALAFPSLRFAYL